MKSNGLKKSEYQIYFRLQRKDVKLIDQNALALISFIFEKCNCSFFHFFANVSK